MAADAGPQSQGADRLVGRPSRRERSGRIRQAAERVPGGGMAAFSPSPLGSVPAETGHWSAPLGAEPGGWAHGGIAEGAGPDLDPGREAPLGPCGAWWRGKGGERPGYSTA